MLGVHSNSGLLVKKIDPANIDAMITGSGSKGRIVVDFVQDRAKDQAGRIKLDSDLLPHFANSTLSNRFCFPLPSADGEPFVP